LLSRLTSGRSRRKRRALAAAALRIAPGSGAAVELCESFSTQDGSPSSAHPEQERAAPLHAPGFAWGGQTAGILNVFKFSLSIGLDIP
jgi:hypothetical protein